MEAACVEVCKTGSSPVARGDSGGSLQANPGCSTLALGDGVMNGMSLMNPGGRRTIVDLANGRRCVVVDD
ncbi:MAG: hypothetical protein ACREPS_11325, partial [Rhodanobacteraceae bacterium]